MRYYILSQKREPLFHVCSMHRNIYPGKHLSEGHSPEIVFPIFILTPWRGV